MTIIEDAAGAMVQAYEELGEAAPGGYTTWTGDGVIAMMTGSSFGALNAVISADREVDVDALAESAGKMARDATSRGLPWSIHVRGQPSAEVIRLAGEYGLSRLRERPLMVNQDLAPYAGPVPAGPVRVVSGSEREAYVAAVSAGYEMPPDAWGPALAAEVLDHPDIAAYLLEHDGVDVSTGMGVAADRFLCVFYISTPAAHRRNGYARTISEAILRDGANAGLSKAVLHSTDQSLPLYESFGFVTVETWTSIS